MSGMTRRGFLALTSTAAAGAVGLAGCSGGSDEQSKAAPADRMRVDTTVWRQYGTPLVEPTGLIDRPGEAGAASGRTNPTGSGPLDGETVAVKDLYAVEGQLIGAGNEAWLAQARPQRRTAPPVEELMAAGAAIAGIARTDEFAYSLAGTNGHYGTPPNPAAPDRIPGGSSSGSASAVALGQATIGLGTDTGGSIRIPSSYQGLYGIRTTHGAISTQGLLALAPSFDTVGWMTRAQEDLVRVAGVLEPDLPETFRFSGAVYADALIDLADADVTAAVKGALQTWSADLPIERITFDTAALPEWARAFQTRQGWEAWQAHGDWIEQHWDSLNPDVRSRFEVASMRTSADLTQADSVLASARVAINQALGDAVLILPSASSVAPPRDAAAMGSGVIEDIRARTFQLTCLAGITGRPAVSSPLPVQGPPIGICAVGPPQSDRALAALRITG